MEAIEKGFPDDVAREFRGHLTARPVIQAVGYGGGDFFDVNVAIAAMLAGSLAGIRVIWLTHSGHSQHLVAPNPPAAGMPAFSFPEILAAKGADVSILCGPTDFLLRHLGGQWGFPPLADPPARTPRNPTARTGAHQRSAATDASVP
ncbi:MAG: hypothetical protein IRZ08_15490, partial [Frankia sp.]|nr:hypothetical protein [Frankia sp.]